MNANNQKYRRVSYAQAKPELAKDNPLNRTQPLTPRFEAERCTFNAEQLADAAANDSRQIEREAFNANRRKHMSGSQMVHDHNPHPELKPTPELSHGSKEASFYSAWEKERDKARTPAQSKKAGEAVNSLLSYLDHLDQEATAAKQITQGGPNKTLADVEREAFKLLRRVHERGEQVMAKSPALRTAIKK